jgi:hypothetical protein
LIIPTSDQSGRWYGNEYLQLYRRIDRSDLDDLRFFEAGGTRGSPLSAL